MHQISAIFFDVDDTLYSTTAFAQLARRRAVEAMVRQGLRLPAEVVRRELGEVIAEFTSNYPNHFDKLLLRLPAESWAGTNRALIVAAGIMAYHATKGELRPFPDVLPFLQQLQQRTDVLVGVITHGLEIKQAEKLLLLGVVPFLHPEGIFISDQVGISKPNPKLWLRACARFGLDPREVMYVGDNPLQDVDPASTLGMITVRVRRPDTRCDELEGKATPRYDVRSFDELAAHLVQDFGLPLETPQKPGP
ncbi:MAG: HAD-IA family hydrolase [Planctomycetes bacterium]|nr:HAD-IA family hydrolase [Planctomycetota bacterium]